MKRSTDRILTTHVGSWISQKAPHLCSPACGVCILGPDDRIRHLGGCLVRGLHCLGAGPRLQHSLAGVLRFGRHGHRLCRVSPPASLALRGGGSAEVSCTLHDPVRPTPIALIPNTLLFARPEGFENLLPRLEGLVGNAGRAKQVELEHRLQRRNRHLAKAAKHE